MDSAWIGVIGASVGAIVGGLLHHYADRSAFLHQRNWERDKLIQQKLEEIYLLTREAHRSITDVFVEARNAGQGLREYSGETEQELRSKLRRLQALTLFYAPERLQSGADKLRRLYDEAALERIKNADAKEVVKQYVKLEAVRDAVKNLEDETVRLARERLGVDDAWNMK